MAAWRKRRPSRPVSPGTAGPVAPAAGKTPRATVQPNPPPQLRPRFRPAVPRNTPPVAARDRPLTPPASPLSESQGVAVYAFRPATDGLLYSRMTAPQIPGIEILETARESSTAVTWKALQRSLDRLVSVRVLKPDVTEPQREAYESVARAVAHIKHPNLIQVIDVARCDDGTSYTVLEAVEGVTLKEELKRDVQFTPLKAAKIGVAIADALDAAWKQASLIHRNLKPEDLCITRAGTVKIIEFSAATLIQPGSDPLSHDGGLIVGTPNYMSPEQAQGRHDLDFHSDMYGLGALLYHLVTGVAPFAFEPDPARVMELQIMGSLPSPRVANAKVSAGLDAVIARCMMKDPNARYAWWQDVVADLQRASKGRPVSRPEETNVHSLSTIAAFTPPRSVPGRRSASDGAAARVAAREGGRPEGGPSSGTRFLLWALLAAGLATLAVHRWKNPDRPAAVPPERTATPPQPAAAPSASPAEAPVRAPDAPSAETATTPSVASQIEVPASPSTPASAAVGTLSEALVATVAEALRREDLNAARELLRAAAGREGGETERAAALKALDGALTTDDVVGIRLLESYRGKLVRVTFRGRELTVTPDRYAAGFAMVELVAADGTKRPWSMKIAELGIADRLRFLGIPPDAGAPEPATDAAIALLAVASEDRDLMRRMAVRVPGLAPFLTYAADH